MVQLKRPNPKGNTYLSCLPWVRDWLITNVQARQCSFLSWAERDDGMKGLQIPLRCALVEEDTGTLVMSSPAGTLGDMPLPHSPKEAHPPTRRRYSSAYSHPTGDYLGSGLYWSMYISATFSKQLIHKGEAK